MDSILNPYLEEFLEIADKPMDLVRVSKENIEILAKRWAGFHFEIPQWREDVFPANDWEFADFLGVVTGINFSFRDCITREKYRTNFSGKWREGSDGMTAAMLRAWKEDRLPVTSPDFLMELDLLTLKQIFREDIPLLAERLNILKEIGIVLKYKYGSFSGLLEASRYQCFNKGKGAAERLVADFPCAFNDVSFYKGKAFNFHKKAQLFCYLYQGRALSSGGKLPLLSGTEGLIPLADYQVPKILNQLGILLYDSRLSTMIDVGIIIPKSSAEENEIRIKTVRAVIALRDEINYCRALAGEKAISLLELDYVLWKSGRECRRPHHLTSTTMY